MKCPACSSDNPEKSQFCSQCATPLASGEKPVFITKTIATPAEELGSGSIFADRFQIIEELGHGGMGRVYRVLDNKLKEEVALKLIKPEIISDKKIIERFRNELKLARKISHKNVCRTYEFMEHENTAFITMEYIRGESLRQLMQKIGTLNVGHAISLAKQVCEGLSEAHNLGIVHRDLKLSNLMIDESGNVHILDFGLAVVEKDSRITSRGMVVGTPAYMAPEQAEGKSVDQRTDIYALGVILYEMLTGRLPFEAETPVGIALKQKLEEPENPQKLNPQIPTDLSRLVLKCLEKMKMSRYPSAEKVLENLTSIERGLPTPTKEVRAQKPATSKAITVTFGRPKLFGFMLAIFALVAAALLIKQLLPKREIILPPKIQNSIAILGFEDQTGSDRYGYLKKAIPSLLITNLENSGDYYVATWERLQDLLKQMGREDKDLVDRDIGFELCRREGIEVIVVGSYIKAGEVFATDVKVLDVETKKLIKSVSSQGEGVDSILRMQIDELSREISLSLSATRPEKGEAPARIEDVTTSSMEAYNNFLKGREAFDKFYFDDALEFLERGVVIDPDFAVAYLYLGRTLHQMLNIPERNRAYQRAYDLSSQASEKDRIYINAIYAETIEGDLDKSLSIYRELVLSYPMEKRAHYSLGRHLNSRGLHVEAIAELNKALELDPEFGSAINLIAYSYMGVGDYENAIAALRRYAEAFPKDANPHDSMGEILLRSGQLEEAIAEFKQALEIRPDFGSDWGLAYVHAYKEEYSEAIATYRSFIENAVSPGRKAGGYLMLGILYDFKGEPELALESIRNAQQIAGNVGNQVQVFMANYLGAWVLYGKADYEGSQRELDAWFGEVSPGNLPIDTILYNLLQIHLDLQSGRIDQSKARLTEMDSTLTSIEPILRELFSFQFQLLWGETFLMEGRLADLILVYERLSDPGLPSFASIGLMFYNLPVLRDVLARAYLEAGEIDKAIAAYERLITFDPMSANRFLIHPLYHYRLGQLYEKNGESVKAQEQLQIWEQIRGLSPSSD